MEMMRMNDFSELQKIILTILKDGKLYSGKELLKISRSSSMLHLKEELLSLLKLEQVQCYGSYWKLAPNVVPPQLDADLKTTDLCVRCPRCQELLDTPESPSGLKAGCPFCGQRFIIGPEKLSPSQYRAIPMESRKL